MSTSVMISYNSAQRAFAESLKARLRAAGLEVWIDREGIRPGMRWREGFVDAVRSRDVFVPVLSQSFLESSHCRLEVLTARSFGKKIAPVMVDDCMRMLSNETRPPNGVSDAYL